MSKPKVIPPVFTERKMPHSLDAERSVLGAILSDNSQLELLAEKLKPSEFFLDTHRRVYELMIQMREAATPIDTLTLMDKLTAVGELETVGGIAYLDQLGDSAIDRFHTEHYAKIIREKAALRQIIHTCHSIQEASFEETEEPSKIIASADALLSQIDIEWGEEDGVTLRAAALRWIEESEKGGGIRAYSGIPHLDEDLGGAREGEIWVITASKTGAGKTLMADQIMRCACKSGLHGLYCSGEMFAHHLVSRGLATDADVWHSKMRRPEELNADDRMRLADAALRQCDICAILDGELSISRIRQAARRKKKKDQLHLVVIDYDALVDAPGKTDLEIQMAVVKGAKRIAMQFGVPVFLVSQLNKNIKPGEMVTINSLYGTSRKANDASVVLYVERKFVEKLEGDETEGRILILKARDGRVGSIPVKFDVSRLRFVADEANDQWRKISRQNALESQERPKYAVEDAIQDDPEPPSEEE